MLDEIDIQFLLLITRGYNNSYAIYTQLKKEAEQKGTSAMTYKNVNRRILILVEIGVIEEVKYTERIPHGRIDYKLTMKGLEGGLIPFVLLHGEEIPNVIRYMDKTGLDKNLFGIALLEKHTSMTKLLNIFQDNTGILFNDSYWSKLASESKLSGRINRTIENFNAEMETLIENISDSSDSQRKYDESIDQYQEAVAKERKYKSAKEPREEEADEFTVKTTPGKKKKPT